MAYTDTQGHTVSTSSSSALTAYEQGANLWIRWRSGAMEALDSAIADDPQFTLAHCAPAYLGWRMGRGDIGKTWRRRGRNSLNKRIISLSGCITSQ
jgi:hypothetical protein